MKDIADRVRLVGTKVLSRHKHLVRLVTFAWRRSDGDWQEQTREVYDKGDGATILLYNRARRSVVLIRQFRLPAFLLGNPSEEAHADEVAAGLALTGYFLLERVLRPHGKDMPPARLRLDAIVLRESE